MSEAKPIAIISDVHGNLEALTAVLNDIRSQDIETIINLGDCVGYGADAEACIDILQIHATINICGNHDYAVLNSAEGFNYIAKNAVDYVRSMMNPKSYTNPDDNVIRRWRFLNSLIPLYELGKYEFMHGSPRQPITEYVLPSDPEMDPFKLDSIFSAMTGDYAFVGHTHFPGVIEDDNDSYLMIEDLSDLSYNLTAKKAIINVGSVGQPRDYDSRSCYAVLRRGHVEWRRVEYDIETTISKISSHPVLDDQSGMRLKLGR